MDLEQQLPGSFEHAVHYLLEHEFDLSLFDTRYRNDQSGVSAYPPGMLLKVILCAYAQGVVSSRGIERLCREHATFIALSGDSAPHFTTLVTFISSLDEEVAQLFAQALYLNDRQGLIGREMFAIDGVKLPSNASKARSATAQMTAFRSNPTLPRNPGKRPKAWGVKPPNCANGRPIIRRIAKAPSGRATAPTRTAPRWRPAKASYKAYRRGSGRRQKSGHYRSASPWHRFGAETAAAGYHSDANLKIRTLAEEGISALIADNGMRQRDERFKDQSKHKAKPDPLYDKAHPKKAAKRYRPQDFTLDPATGICTCPAGKQLYRNGTNCIHNGRLATKYSGTLRDCLPCEQRIRCLRTAEKTQVRQIAFFRGKADITEESHTDRMKRAIDSDEGKARYGRKFATVEPVFGNIRHNKRLDRFKLRGCKKLYTQWKLYCLVHNIEKLAHHAFGQ